MIALEFCRLFRDLSPAELTTLRQIAQERKIPAGQKIFGEGDPGDGMYVVAEGLVEISARINQDTERPITRIGPGEIFGEMAVIELKPRSASARAAEDSVVFFVPREELLDRVQRSPALAMELLREISQRLREFDQRYIQEILQTERLAVIGRFARSIVHDLKNPLNVIGLSAELAGMDKASPENRRAAAANIRDQVDRVNDLISEILLFTQGTSSDYVLGVLDYPAFVQGAVEELRKEVELRGARIESGTTPGRLKVAFDAKRLRSVFRNLVHNAAEAMPDGGTILVRCRVADNEIITEIEDNGPGVAPEMSGKLFQAFATHGKVTGTGLGLSICKRIVEDHHGRIWAQNKAGRGAIFAFALPLPQG